ncbi:hypothetical protein [Streptomyces sp. NPDC047976]|uniref:hypothetical protein n=1 Tax=Streptomyces sp. NPDC047976 TaxID=3155746 RepID=UPI003414AE40
MVQAKAFPDRCEMASGASRCLSGFDESQRLLGGRIGAIEVGGTDGRLSQPGQAHSAIARTRHVLELRGAFEEARSLLVASQIGPAHPFQTGEFRLVQEACPWWVAIGGALVEGPPGAFDEERRIHLIPEPGVDLRICLADHVYCDCGRPAPLQLGYCGSVVGHCATCGYSWTVQHDPADCWQRTTESDAFGADCLRDVVLPLLAARVVLEETVAGHHTLDHLSPALFDRALAGWEHFVDTFEEPSDG